MSEMTEITDLSKQKKICKIVFEDNHLLVVFKYAGVLSQAASLNLPDINDYLKKYLKEKYQKPGNVYLANIHRLDTNTIGLLVFAKTSKAAKRLSIDFKEHKVKKSYLAAVEGILDKKADTLINKIQKDEKNKIALIKPSGDTAILNYRVVSEDKNNSIIKIELITGRFHQIRCQMAYIHHPLLGDIKYKAKTKSNEPNLQCYRLEFIHPVTKETLVLEEIEKIGHFKHINLDRS